MLPRGLIDRRNRRRSVNAGRARNPGAVNGERVRSGLLNDFNIEIGTSFGQLQGRIWRIGAMGYNARKDAVLITLAALETVLAAEGFKLTRGAGVDAARAVYAAAESVAAQKTG